MASLATRQRVSSGSWLATGWQVIVLGTVTGFARRRHRGWLPLSGNLGGAATFSISISGYVSRSTSRKSRYFWTPHNALCGVAQRQLGAAIPSTRAPNPAGWFMSRTFKNPTAKHLSIHLCVHVSIHPFIPPSIHLYIWLCMYPFILSFNHPSIHLFIYSYIHAFTYPVMHPFIYVSIYLFVCVFIH